MENNLTLFQISQDLLEIFYAIEENEGELTPEAENALIIKEEQLNEKGGNYRKAIVYLQGQEKLVKEEVARLKVLEKKFKTNAERLKAGLLQAVLLFGEEDKPTKAQKMSGRAGTKRLTVRDFGNIVNLSNRQTVVCKIEEIEDLDSNYVNLTLPKVSKQDLERAIEDGDRSFLKMLLEQSSADPNKSLITEDLKAEIEVKGASLEVSHSLTIK